MISSSIKDDIFAIRGNATLFKFEDRAKRRVIDELLVNTLHPNIKKWFHENVIHELFVIKNRIGSLENKDIRDFSAV